MKHQQSFSPLSNAYLNQRPSINDNLYLQKEKAEPFSAKKEIKTSSNKLKRYKIGLLFFVFYGLLSGCSLFGFKYSNLHNLNPFSEAFLEGSVFPGFLIISLIMGKIPSQKTFNFMNILKYYVPDWKKDISLVDYRNGSSTFYAFEGTEEKFRKNVYKLSFNLAILLYFYIAFFYLSLSYTTTSTVNSNMYLTCLAFPLSSITVIIFLRRYFLNTQRFDILGTISLIVLLLGVVFLFFFQYEVYLNSKVVPIYGFSALSGVFFGGFNTLGKYYYNVYGTNFKISLVFGFIGLFIITGIPLVLCCLCIGTDEKDSQMFTLADNSWLFWVGNYIVNVLKTITAFHGTIALSPLVFSMGIFLDVTLNGSVHGLLKEIKADSFLYIAGSLILIGVAGGSLDKFGKNKIKDKETKLNEELGDEVDNKKED